MAVDAPTADIEHAQRLAWLKQVRKLHHTKRMLGFAGIILGAAVLMWWKLDVNAPAWALGTGTGILVASWALFVYVIVARYQWVRKHPYGPTQT